MSSSPHVAVECLADFGGETLIRRIVEFHGGRAWVESDGLEKGATFLFSLSKTQRVAPGEGLKGDEAHASIPVVVLSTSDNDRDISRAYASHANSYLVKPTDLSTLETMLRVLHDYWIGWNNAVSGEALPGT